MQKKPAIAFWGTPPLTIAYLDALESVGLAPMVVITNPDRPKGRGHELASPEPKLWAEARGIPVLQPEKLDDTFYEKLAGFDLDLSVVVAYGSLLTERFIDLPKHRTLNVHYSLLPLLRGAAPTEAAILSGAIETGCAIQVMERALDSGAIVAQERTPIDADETTPVLRARLTAIGTRLLTAVVPRYLAGELFALKQEEALATRCGKIRKEDGLLELSLDAAGRDLSAGSEGSAATATTDGSSSGQKALEKYRKYRAYFEWPRTYFFAKKTAENGATKDGGTIRVIVTKAHYADGQFVVDRVLPEGKKDMAYAEFAAWLGKK